MSKFTFADCTRFDALIKDVFPGIDFKEVEYDELSSALKQVFEEANYEVIPNQVTVRNIMSFLSQSLQIVIISLFLSHCSSVNFTFILGHFLGL
jgi:dynein heavy chain 2